MKQLKQQIEELRKKNSVFESDLERKHKVITNMEAEYKVQVEALKLQVNDQKESL